MAVFVLTSQLANKKYEYSKAVETPQISIVDKILDKRGLPLNWSKILKNLSSWFMDNP